MDTDVSKEHASSIFKAKERHESLERTASPTRYLSVRLHFGYFDLLRKKHLKPNEVVHIFKCSTYVCACACVQYTVYTRYKHLAHVIAVLRAYMHSRLTVNDVSEVMLN
jgi:hypothetical protein